MIYRPSWETSVIENILAVSPGWRASFYRTSAGTEIDLVLEKRSMRMAIECKVSSAPNLGQGFWNALKDLGVQQAFVVAPVDETHPIKDDVKVTPLGQILQVFQP